MNVSKAVANRKSIRAFTEQKIDPDQLVEILTNAARAPSGGNVQPWRIYLLQNEKLVAFKELMLERLSGTAHPDGESPEYSVYPQKMEEPYRTSRFEVGEDMYALLDIARDEKPKRLQWFANNFQFFGAPAAIFCFVDRKMGPPQWSDLGMYLQTVMLLLQEQGIESCAQEAWSMYPKTVSEFCGAPDNWMIFCGMAIGYADNTHPVNQLETKRLPTDQWLKVL